MMTDIALREVLATAVQAALEAGNYFKSRFQTELVVHTKSSLADVVTDVDKHCEALIRAQIEKQFKAHDILGEEGVAPGREASMEAAEKYRTSAALWIVDPLDGTTNFVSGIPLSVVSIAFATEGTVQVGVIYDPYRGDVFYSIRGQGAYLTTVDEAAQWLKKQASDYPGGIRLSASDVTELPRAVLATGLPMRHVDRPLMMERASHIIQAVKSLRTLGAAALHMAYVAAGRIDIFWEFELNAWDVAAGTLLIEEAGGVVGDIDGSPYTLMTRDIIASGNERVASQISVMLSGRFEGER